MHERNQLIDNLRGFAMLVIIVIHTTAFFTSNKLIAIIWNWSHFAVPIFLFCSTYLFLQKGFAQPVNFLSYLRKRFLRLLIPYYLFFGFFVVALFLVSPKVLTIKYILRSLVLTGGVDINWLVLLFLYITILLPFFVWCYQKARIVFWLYLIITCGSTAWLLFNHFPYSYRWIMWLPWSVMLFFTWFSIKFEHKRWWLLLISFSLFIISFVIQNTLHHSLVLINNKYPPNIFYLSYGLTILLLLTYCEKYIFRQKMIAQILHFFSRYSYSIFFLHYLLLTIFAAFISRWHLQWMSFFVLVLGFTVLLQYGFVMLKEKTFK